MASYPDLGPCLQTDCCLGATQESHRNPWLTKPRGSKLGRWSYGLSFWVLPACRAFEWPSPDNMEAENLTHFRNYFPLIFWKEQRSGPVVRWPDWFNVTLWSLWLCEVVSLKMHPGDPAWYEGDYHLWLGCVMIHESLWDYYTLAVITGVCLCVRVRWAVTLKRNRSPGRKFNENLLSACSTWI